MTEDFQRWNCLKAETVFQASASYSYPHALLNGVLFLRHSKHDNRSILTLESQGSERDITPQGYSLRTTINEYGGKPFWLDGTSVLFANLTNQCLYKHSISYDEVTAPIRVSCLPTPQYRYAYAEINFLTPNLVVAIVEKQFFDHGIENESFLGLIDLSSPDQEPGVLHEVGDFHSNLVFHSSSGALAWVQWDHPNMPWDNTSLVTAKITFDSAEKSSANEVSLEQISVVDTDYGCSVCQLIYANNGTLFFSADYVGCDGNDARNFWNIYALKPAAPRRIVAVTSGFKEYGYPHWQYGNSRIVQYDHTRLLSVASSERNDEIIVIDQDTLAVERLPNRPFHYDNLSSTGQGEVFALRLANDLEPAISKLNNLTGLFEDLICCSETLDNNQISIGEHISFAGRDGVAHGFYYPPINDFCESSPTEAPPLLVMVHGGPSARAYASLDLQKQYWVQRGFAIFDVNHRGSSGYGRNYRDALYGAWGELDCSDIIDGIRFLVDKNLANPGKICIRGKSAGGFTVLRALTEYPDVFAAGACYYGIANLATLAEHTHKFEKYYTDRLIGEPFDKHNSAIQDSVYFQRSPINNLQSLDSAMIIFQGAQDKVVPPSLAHELVSSLEKLGLSHTYIEYAEEGHGFKKINNNIDALENEFAFYQSALNT